MMYSNKDLELANMECRIAAKEENEKVIEAMWEELILLPNLMADPRFYGPDIDEGVAPWDE